MNNSHGTSPVPYFIRRGGRCSDTPSLPDPDGASWKLDAQERPAGKKGMVRVKLHLSKIGTVKLHLHWDMAGTIKTLTIKREGEHWYACCSCEFSKSEALPVGDVDVGIDLGVAHFAALSTGEFLDHPRYFGKTEKKLKQLQAIAGKRRSRQSLQRIAKFAPSGGTFSTKPRASWSIGIRSSPWKTCG